MSIQYQVFLTPRIDSRTFGAEVEISDRVLANKVGSIRQTIDSADFSIGVYTHNAVALVCDNSDGFFSIDDSRSAFIFSRDLAKLRIVWVKTTKTIINGENFTQETKITFRGLLEDEDTRQNIKDDSIKLKILSRDSVIRKSKITQGTVSDGVSYKNGMIAILNTEDITSVLNLDAANINPEFNGIINDGSKFDNIGKKKALDQLLGASNSYLFIDENDNIIIKSRLDANLVKPIKLYGKSELSPLENILDIRRFNTGLHRTFNSVVVNGTEANNNPSILENGFRQRNYTFSFINVPAQEALAATAIVNEFGFPKIEVELEVTSELMKDSKLLDRVLIDYPLRVFRTGSFFPIVGQTAVGDIESPVAGISGSVAIKRSRVFKIIELNEDVNSFQTTLKLREIGTGTGDGEDPGLWDTTLFAQWVTKTNADWGEGSVTSTPTGVATINNSRLEIFGTGDVSFPAAKNITLLLNQGTFRFDYTPNYTGNPVANRFFINAAAKASSDTRNLIETFHRASDGKLVFELRDENDNILVTFIGPTFAAVSGTKKLLEFAFDLFSKKIWIFVDGVTSEGTITGTGKRDLNVGVLFMGKSLSGGGTPNDGAFNNLQIYSKVQHENDYEVA